MPRSMDEALIRFDTAYKHVLNVLPVMDDIKRYERAAQVAGNIVLGSFLRDCEFVTDMSRVALEIGGGFHELSENVSAQLGEIEIALSNQAKAYETVAEAIRD